ncbi:MAG: DEAD/DEAH box helicase, partial [Holosporales bacterium]|nr:DEAD/DEAH box helicase [Holosporales bacterium]
MILDDSKGIPIDRIPFLLKNKSDDIETIVFITLSNNVDYLVSILKSIFDNKNIIYLNFFSSDIYENIFCDILVFAKRAKALTEILLSNNKKQIIVTTLEAMNYKAPEKKYFLEKKEISCGDSLKMSELIEILANFGYWRSEIVSEIGQFSVRGGILDVFIPIMDNPIRIDFLGNKIDSIREFSVDSQISVSNIDQAFITKCSEIVLTDDSIRLFRSKMKTRSQTIIESIENGYFFNGIEWYLPYFHEKTISVLNYLPNNTKFILDFETFKRNKEFVESKMKRDDQVFSDSVSQIYKSFDYIELNPFENNDILKDNNYKYDIRLERDKNKLLNSISNKKTIFSVSSNGAFFILSDILSGVSFEKIEKFFEEPSGKINVIISPLKKGFISDDLSVYTEKELFGEILRSGIKPKTKDILKQYSKLSIGDYVVHERHGIAIFEGMRNITVSGISHDFLTLLYKNADRLYVPVENIALVSRYGGAQINVDLDQLKSGVWNKRKDSVKKKLLIIAISLLEIAAKRKLQNLSPLEINYEEYDKFCKGFGYVETEDQQIAIEAMISDLKNSTPMDRLICGDVGFGKTEIAIRAAFIVASSGKQVVFLAPTTILVSQHYKNFTERFKNFEIEICQLSRFIPKKQTEESISKIAAGKIKIIIATHAVLSLKIKFNNLGLIVIDEEQHFGVRQKEFLKSIREDAHFMTLSATPIPRTLQLAMSEIKDLSMIATPPIDRKPVKTVICDFIKETIEKAIEAEIKTGGQVFFVTPRVEYLDEVYNVVTALFPGLSIAKACGKTKNLETTIQAFCDEKIKVLVSTNIIDSGIDIPNANTILIHRCDLFGLSQLYQLRGRVGRSNKQAYAYFLLPKFKTLTENSKKRLEILKDLNNLGAGFL